MDVTVNFSGRGLDYTAEEIAVALEAMRSANPLTQGPYRQIFEEKFQSFNGVAHAFAMSNGTCALEIAAQLCRLKEGDEVLIPSHTFTSSAYPFLKHGGRAVWADIDPLTRVVTADTLERAMTPRTKVIVVVHLYGYVADMPSIAALARERGILVVEDACQAIGADIDGQRSGSFADFGVFSFHSHKNLTTLGEGGMLVTADDALADLVPLLRHNGHCPFDFPREDYWIPAMGNVDLPELAGEPLWPGNFCLGEVECALGAKQLERVDEINAQKRRRALAFIDALREYPELVFHRVESSRHNYHLLAARMEGSVARRDDFMRRMLGEHGVRCVVQYYPLNRYPFYRKLGFGRADCPAADNFFDHMISFPFQHNLSEDEFCLMLAATKRVLDEQRKMRRL
ncbi:MAG: DegT/DnrJ/EryC1/StrS family aminotransferase [Deltaproteobacteria bacterium]|jgi:dTDP-4-amino-4,6-dideoxygalactose transaminase|nr:DegT/DnrJ/EryC1/StrS family aminotransferase [Deltaproteobacteria bacterium]